MECDRRLIDGFVVGFQEFDIFDHHFNCDTDRAVMPSEFANRLTRQKSEGQNAENEPNDRKYDAITKDQAKIYARDAGANDCPKR